MVSSRSRAFHLAIIASVSRFCLLTRRPQDEAGIRIDVLPEGVQERPEACPAGTRVIVELEVGRLGAEGMNRRTA